MEAGPNTQPERLQCNRVHYRKDRDQTEQDCAGETYKKRQSLGQLR